MRFLILSFILIFSFTDMAFAGDEKYSGKAGVFGIASDSTSMALTTETADFIKKILNNCGRFIPVENKQLDSAFDRAKKSGDTNIYNHAAELLKLDIYIMVSSFQIGNIIYSDLDIIPLNNLYSNLKKRIRLRSRNNLNIPLKTGREIVILHEGLPVIARVEKVYEDNLYLINAGEWHGLKNNTDYRIQETIISVIQAGRFESLVKIPLTKHKKEKIIIKIYPDTDKIINELNDDISRNTISKHSIADVSGSNTEKRLLESICLINIGSNVCVPGYGAFLSTGYMGFKNPQPDIYGITLSTSLIIMHLLLPEIMTDFKINFLPWNQDSDKTERMQDFQKFLWLSLPFTFSASYMGQLASQFARSEILPPFFEDRDNVAGLFSLFIPGGGLFYKGRRLAGWGFYFSEMMLAGYAVYNHKEKKGKYALYALGAVKFTDVLYAFFAKSNYSFYDLELEREINIPVEIGFRTGAGDDNIFNVMISTDFK